VQNTLTVGDWLGHHSGIVGFCARRQIEDRMDTFWYAVGVEIGRRLLLTAEVETIPGIIACLTAQLLAVTAEPSRDIINGMLDGITGEDDE
jgi:hypothetical protein